jgi:vacuolar-type H+-ATPase subunit H
MSSTQSIQSATSSDVQHTTINKENVNVSSSITHDTTDKVTLNDGSDKLDQLMNRLSTTHEQLDLYTQRRTHQISVETRHIIEKILEETKEKQKQLLLEAKARSQQLQFDYQQDLQTKINQLNEEKAQQLADLEKNLNIQQENILTNARQQIDLLQSDANQVCLSILFFFIFFSFSSLA